MNVKTMTFVAGRTTLVIHEPLAESVLSSPHNTEQVELDVKRSEPTEVVPEDATPMETSEEDTKTININAWWTSERFESCTDCRSFAKSYSATELKTMARDCNLESHAKKSELAANLWSYAKSLPKD